MRIGTVEEAVALIGTTWERDGLRRTITRIDGLRPSSIGMDVCGNVYWCRPGKPERKSPQWLPYFNDWLTKATKVES